MCDFIAYYKQNLKRAGLSWLSITNKISRELGCRGYLLQTKSQESWVVVAIFILYKSPSDEDLNSEILTCIVFPLLNNSTFRNKSYLKKKNKEDLMGISLTIQLPLKNEMVNFISSQIGKGEGRTQIYLQSKFASLTYDDERRKCLI